MTDKAEGAFKTIGELSAELGLPQHILRYWETKFRQLKPLTRAGNRRYYRTNDVALAHRINNLLYQQGYTIKGVQKVLNEGATASAQPAAVPAPQAAPAPQTATGPDPAMLQALISIRQKLAAALAH